MENVQLRVQRLAHGKDLPLPSYSHPGDAGLDICSSEDKVLKPGETTAVKTGLCMAIPDGYVGLIWDRSGLAVRHSVHTLAGVVDAGYRGEIQAVLRNSGNEEFSVTKGMRVAQMLIQPVIRTTITESDSLGQTSRNEGGFGSTGK